MAVVVREVERRSFAELTSTCFGRPMSAIQTLEHLMGREFTPDGETAARGTALAVLSVGYERHKDSGDFAKLLREAGVECLIDVRELPISRRRGYAKTALGEAMEAAGVGYLHVKQLGNPKAFRDLYKSGRVEEGRAAYRDYLVGQQGEALQQLGALLEEKRCALMCVEHDPSTCHRTVIIEELRTQLGLELAVEAID